MTHRHRNSANGWHPADPRARPAAVLKRIQTRRPATVEREGVVWLGFLATLAALCLLIIVRALGE